jgi:hypothetical protein
MFYAEHRTSQDKLIITETIASGRRITLSRTSPSEYGTTNDTVNATLSETDTPPCTTIHECHGAKIAHIILSTPAT